MCSAIAKLVPCLLLKLAHLNQTTKRQTREQKIDNVDRNHYKYVTNNPKPRLVSTVKPVEFRVCSRQCKYIVRMF